MGIFVAWFLFWVAGNAFGPVQFHPDPADVPPQFHEAAETGAN